MALLGQRRQSRRPERKRRESLATKGPDSGIITIERLAHDGRGVARSHAGKILFVEQALPGEEVEIGIHTQHGRFDEAHVRQVISASEARVTPGCQHFGRCGGCDLQHLDIDGQRDHKRQVLREHFERHDVALPDPELLADASWGYRRRARLGVRVGSNDHIHLGYRIKGQDRLFDIRECPILEPRLQRLLAPLRALVETLESPRRLGHIELMAGDNDVMITLRQLKRVPVDLARWQAFAREHELLLSASIGDSNSMVLERLDDAPAKMLTYQPSHDDRSPVISVRSGDFLQANAEVNRKLVETVLAWAQVREDMQITDLFAGVGNFTLVLAAAGACVTAYEGRESMVQRLRDNAQAAGLSHRVDARCTDLGQAPSGLSLMDLVVLDPPRAGALGICKAMAECGPDRVLYISCEPATLARDVHLMTEGGYQVTKALMADMFPHTAHLESLVLLERHT